jgi:hypothetical protein
MNAATKKIQTQLTSAKSKGLRIGLSPGDTLIDADLWTGQVCGGVLEGKGASELLDYKASLSNVGTRLIASGQDRVRRVLLNVNGSSLAVRDLTCQGWTRAEGYAGAEKAECAIRLNKTAEGLGVGDLLLENLYITGWKKGVQAGIGLTENNCERTAFIKVRFQSNDAGFVTKSQQSMGFGLDHCEWYDNLDCIRVEGGGKIIVNEALVMFRNTGEEHTFLRIAARDSELSIGPNNAMYVVNGLYADQNAPNLKLVKMTPLDDNGKRVGYYSKTTFNNFHISNEYYAQPAVEVCGYSDTILRDGYGMQPGWLSWDNGDSKMLSRIVVENCTIFNCKTYLDLISKYAKGFCSLVFRGNVTALNEAIPDHIGILKGAST